MSVVIRSNQAMTNPPMNAPYAPGRATYRVRFSAGDSPSLVGMATGGGDGLVLALWEGTANGLASSGGRAVRGSAAGVGFIGLPVAGVGIEFTLDIPLMPTAGTLFFDIFRAALGGSPNAYRLEVGAGTARLRQRINGLITTVGPSVNISNGDRIGVRYAGGVLTMLVNGAVVSIARPDPINLTGYAGIAWDGDATGFALDNVDIDLY